MDAPPILELAEHVLDLVALPEQHDQRSALVIADCVRLGVQSAFRVPDATGVLPCFSRLAAVRYAFV